MFEKIISPENLFAAWREFRRGKRAKADIQQFEFALEDNIFQLHEELFRRVWLHNPYVAFFVTDPKVRHIHKATVRDRLLHHAIFRMLYPIFDRVFIYDSYSCRVGKGTHRAVRRLRLFAERASQKNRRNCWSLKCDIRKFFDSVDHGILMTLIRRKVSDDGTLWLLSQILGSFEKSLGVGIPLGNVTSQLFANIYMHELDRFVKHDLHQKYYLRYCDDFLILADCREVLLGIKDRIADFLWQRLRLSLHPNKIVVRTYRQGIDFTGYVVRPYCTTLRGTTKRRILKRISKNANVERAIPSYLGVLRHCDGYNIAKGIDLALRNIS